MTEFEDRSHEDMSMPENLGKESLSDEQMGNLVSAVGNSEAKALTLLTMKPGVIYSRAGLIEAVRATQFSSRYGWHMGDNLPFNYCERSFRDIGLVAAQVIDEYNNEYGYIKTTYGENIGTRFAATMLDFSRNHPETSLSKLLSSTSSSARSEERGGVDFKKRAPITRLNLFRELMTSPLPAHITDLTQKMGETHSSLVSRHVQELRREGLVSIKNGYIDMPESSEMLLSDLILTLHKFQKGNISVQIHADMVSEFLLSHPSEVSALLKKARENSRNADQSSFEETSGLILSIINKSPGISADNVRDDLETQFGKKLSTHRTRRIIRKLEEEGRLKASKSRKPVLWEVLESDETD